MVAAARKLDTTIYPETDESGEGELQKLINELLRPLLARFLAELARAAKRSRTKPKGRGRGR